MKGTYHHFFLILCFLQGKSLYTVLFNAITLPQSMPMAATDPVSFTISPIAINSLYRKIFPPGCTGVSDREGRVWSKYAKRLGSPVRASLERT
jgi:hypothetical protein